MRAESSLCVQLCRIKNIRLSSSFIGHKFLEGIIKLPGHPFRARPCAGHMGYRDNETQPLSSRTLK